jgi:hypothetical protein
MILAGLMVFGPVMLQVQRTRRQTTQKLGELATATRSYLEGLDQSRSFTPVAVPGLHLQRGEFAIRRDQATLAEFARERLGGGLGTRIHVGGFPIYIGGWKSLPKEELREVGTGNLVLTNHRLLFIGARTVTIPFEKLLTCQQVTA